MRNTFFSLLAATVSFWSWSASAEGETERFKEAEWDWHPGDLIFRNDINEFDELVRRADGAKWASVGILRSSSGGPRVLYVDEKAGVTEAMLYEFVDGLTIDDYAVYRIEDVDPNEPDKLMVQGPLEPPRVYRRVFCLKLTRHFQGRSCWHKIPPLLLAA